MSCDSELWELTDVCAWDKEFSIKWIIKMIIIKKYIRSGSTRLMVEITNRLTWELQPTNKKFYLGLKMESFDKYEVQLINDS